MINSFDRFLNEALGEDNANYYLTYVFTSGTLILNGGDYFSWQYFTNFSDSDDAIFTIDVKKPDVTLGSTRGYPSISIPVDKNKSGTIEIEFDDLRDFLKSKQFELLSQFVDLDIEVPEDFYDK